MPISRRQVVLGGLAAFSDSATAAITQSLLAPRWLHASHEELPYDSRVAWLETDGNSYIDTGMEMAEGHEVIGRHVFRKASTRQLMGSNGSRQFYGLNASGFVEFGTFGNTTSTVQVSDDVVYDISLSAFEGNNIGAVYDGNELLWKGQGPYYSFSTTFRIFRIGIRDSYKFISGNRILAFSHYVNGELVQDLIPVRVGKGMNSVGYMYDTVSGNLYGNAHRGSTLICGPDAR